MLNRLRPPRHPSGSFSSGGLAVFVPFALNLNMGDYLSLGSPSSRPGALVQVLCKGVGSRPMGEEGEPV